MTDANTGKTMAVGGPRNIGQALAEHDGRMSDGTAGPRPLRVGVR